MFDIWKDKIFTNLSEKIFEEEKKNLYKNTEQLSQQLNQLNEQIKEKDSEIIKEKSNVQQQVQMANLERDKAMQQTVFLKEKLESTLVKKQECETNYLLKVESLENK